MGLSRRLSRSAGKAGNGWSGLSRAFVTRRSRNAWTRPAVLVRSVGFEDRLPNERVGRFCKNATAEIIESTEDRDGFLKARESGEQRSGAKDLDPFGEAESLAGEEHAEQRAEHLDRVTWQSAARLRMGEGLKLWAERFEI